MQIDVDSVDFDSKMWPDFSSTQVSDLHKFIFSSKDCNLNFAGKKMDYVTSRLHGEKVLRTFTNFLVAQNKPELNGRVDATISWGGKEGTTVECTGKAEVRTDSGSVDVTAKIDSNGNGQFSAGAEVSTGSKSSNDK